MALQLTSMVLQHCGNFEPSNIAEVPSLVLSWPATASPQPSRRAGTIPIRGGDTSSTAIGARTTSFSKDVEHRIACVGLAGNNLELATNGKPELQATPIRSRFSG